MADLQRIKDYFDKTQLFYLATVDGDKPKCRPFGFSMIEGDKLYFGTGTYKDCYKQIEKNPNVEIACLGEGGWLRLYGRAHLVDDEALSRKALDTMPSVKEAYDSKGYKLGLFYLENATAEFRDAFTVMESIKF